MPDLIERFHRNVSLLADQPAIVHESYGTRTWGELGRRVDALAAGLQERGAQPGARVGVAIYHGTLALELYLAAQVAHLQPVLLGYALGAALPDACADADVVELFSGPQHADHLDAIRAAGVRVWEIDGHDEKASERTVEAASGDPARVVHAAERGVDEISGIQFSTGTTGRPKAMVRSVGADFFDAVNRSLTMRIRLSERWVAASPTNINVAIGALRCMTLLGGSVVALDDVSPESIERNTRDGVTILPLQAPGWRELVASGVAAKLPERGLRVALSTGQRCPRPLLLELQQLMEGHGEVVNSYGLTETSTVAHLTSSMPGFDGLLRAGRPNPMMTVEVAPYADAVADAGDCGEIRVKGPAVSPGYLDLEGGGTVGTEDGWFLTGDVGRWDADGYLCVLGRWKDAVVVGGRYVFPYAVENALQEEAGAREAVLLASDDRLVAVLQADATGLDTAAVERILGDVGATGLVAWAEVDDLPRNASRKINRMAVADGLDALTLHEVSGSGATA